MMSGLSVNYNTQPNQPLMSQGKLHVNKHLRPHLVAYVLVHVHRLHVGSLFCLLTSHGK